MIRPKQRATPIPAIRQKKTRLKYLAFLKIAKGIGNILENVKIKGLKILKQSKNAIPVKNA